MADGSHRRLVAFATALAQAGFETHVEADVAGLVWSKLVINVGINALTALTGRENGRLLDLEETRSLMADLVAEAVAVAKARGVTLTYADPLADGVRRGEEDRGQPVVDAPGLRPGPADGDRLHERRHRARGEPSWASRCPSTRPSPGW